MSKKRILEGIRQLRKEKSLTQKEMAEKLGVTASMYNQLETGRQEISLDRLDAILDILKTDIEGVLLDEKNIDTIIEQQEKILEMLKRLKK